VLNGKIFRVVVDSMPLISIDILLKKGDKVFLGKRVKKPAQGYFFSTGGRLIKMKLLTIQWPQIDLNELNIELKSTSRFIGSFEHFYDDIAYQDVSPHYVNLAYELEVDKSSDLPTDHHSEYKWFTTFILLQSEQVLKYTKDYFRN